MDAMRHTLSATLLLCLLAAPASAQVGKNYDVKTMNFDLWCQEQAGLPVARCDKRLPEDEKTFEAYRATIERYEIPYLEEKRNDGNLARTLLQHPDPINGASDHDIAGSGAQVNQPPRTPPP
jgi:hypothetical protein